MTKKWIKIVEETISENPNTHKLKEILEIAVIKYKKTFKIKNKKSKKKTQRKKKLKQKRKNKKNQNKKSRKKKYNR